STLAESASAQDRLEKLAGQAKNLQDLVDRLNKAKAETGPAMPQGPGGIPGGTSIPSDQLAGDQQLASAEPGPDANGPERMQQPDGFRNFPDAAHISAQNAVFAPARGRILTHFGDPMDTGGQSKGLVLETRPGAQVVAPFDGRIAFEGPF